MGEGWEGREGEEGGRRKEKETEGRRGGGEARTKGMGGKEEKNNNLKAEGENGQRKKWGKICLPYPRRSRPETTKMK